MGPSRKPQSLRRKRFSNERFVDSILRDVEQVTGSVASATGAEGELFQLRKISRASARSSTISQGKSRYRSWVAIARTETARSELAYVISAKASTTFGKSLTSSRRPIARWELFSTTTLIEGLEETVSSVGELVGDLSRVKTEVELKSVYEIPFSPDGYEGGIDIQSAIKNTLGLRIVPRPDSYYMFEAVADPRGKQTRTFTSTSQSTIMEKLFPQPMLLRQPLMT